MKHRMNQRSNALHCHFSISIKMFFIGWFLFTIISFFYFLELNKKPKDNRHLITFNKNTYSIISGFGDYLEGASSSIITYYVFYRPTWSSFDVMVIHYPVKRGGKIVDVILHGEHKKKSSISGMEFKVDRIQDKSGPYIKSYYNEDVLKEYESVANRISRYYEAWSISIGNTSEELSVIQASYGGEKYFRMK